MGKNSDIPIKSELCDDILIISRMLEYALNEKNLNNPSAMKILNEAKSELDSIRRKYLVLTSSTSPKLKINSRGAKRTQRS